MRLLERTFTHPRTRALARVFAGIVIAVSPALAAEDLAGKPALFPPAAPAETCVVPADCDDGDPCNGLEACEGGICVPGTPLPDGDGDGVCDVVDNCPAVSNPNQANADGDAFGDACDSGGSQPLFLADTPWVSSTGNSIYTVDPTSGVMTLRADLGTTYQPILGLAAVDGRVLYATGSDNAAAYCDGSGFACLLLRIELDPFSTSAATVTVVGAVRWNGVQVDEISGLTFRNDGSLYGISQSTNGLYIIDPVTAAATRIGISNVDLYGGDLTFDALDRLSVWVNPGQSSSPGLYRMDPATAQATLLDFDLTGLAGLAAIGHTTTMFGASPATDRLHTVDPVTGMTSTSVRLTLFGSPFNHIRGDLDSPFCESDASCDDAQPCTTDRCTAGGCIFLSLDATCDGIDDDCDGSIDEDYAPEPTSCGVGACSSSGVTSCVNGSIQDSCSPGTPAADDLTCDGIDDDCNGLVDDGYVSQPTSCGVGACSSSGATSCVNGSIQDSCSPGTPAANDLTCDGVDDDCNGLVDDGYVSQPTSCGVGACSSSGATSCVNGSIQDSCSPGTPAANDLTCDGIDDDCNGLVDDGYVSEPTSCGVGACQASGATSCVNGSVQDSCNPGTPAADDLTCDGVDDDCNGLVDDGYVSEPTSCGVGACSSSGATSCVNGSIQDSCSPGTPAADDLTCDGIDDDCNGLVDDGYVSEPTSCGVGACSSAGVTSCVNGSIQDSCSPGTPAADDLTCDGIDDDCNGLVDDGYVSQPTSCGVGACASAGVTSCVNGSIQDSCSPGTPAADDLTCDGIDDDCNGLVDDGYVSQPTSCGVGACQSSGATSCVNGSVQDSCNPGTPAADDLTCDGIDDDCNGLVDDGYVSQPTSCGVGACQSSGATSCVNGSVQDSCNPGTPAADDLTCDGIDDDCNGLVDDGYVSQPTNCGVGACQASGATSCVNGSVQDSCSPGTPAANDLTCDGIDDDCNGLVDDGYVSQPTSCGVGACQASGATSCVNGSVQDSCSPGTPAANDLTCDGIDDDCNGLVDDGYVSEPTSCGVGACQASGATSCVNGSIQDSCSPGTPAASDLTCDGIDDDCNGLVDDGYVSEPTSCGVGACSSAGVTSCVNGSVQDSCNPGTPAANDLTCDGIDDDCNGLVDDGYVSEPTSCGVGACSSAGVTSCVNGSVQDSCNPGTPAADDLTCDGVDDDCNGLIDDGYVSQPTSCGVGACSSAGVTSCVNGSVQDSCNPGTPAANDLTCDGIDDDCNGLVDDGYVSQPSSCGVGACSSAGVTSCVNGSVQDSCSPGTPAANDLTCDGIDDDCNGLVDDGYVSEPTSCGVGACQASGATSCVNGNVQDSCNPGTPAANDLTCDGIDDDCDGSVDEEYIPVVTSCGVGACSAEGLTSCDNGVVNDSCTPGILPEVQDVRWTADPTVFDWLDQGAGVAYDVIGGTVADLLSDGNVSGANCLGNDLATASFTETRPDPDPGTTFYYLVRSQAPECGSGTYGSASAGVERTAPSACP